jgi:hypothetical protein
MQTTQGSRLRWVLSGVALVATVSCTQKPLEVGKNTGALEISKVDLLFVVDDSASMASLEAQLPVMLDGFSSSGASGDGGVTSPSLDDIHLAVVSTDMGVSQDLWKGAILAPTNAGGDAKGNPPPPDSDAGWDRVPDASVDMTPSTGNSASPIPGCSEIGDDGLFAEIKPSDLAKCRSRSSHYLTYDGSKATSATIDAAACLPDVGSQGCGFEHPLEAALKALSPKASPLHFLHGHGHADAENAGFLRDDSLLVVVVVTDEDDCSAEDPTLFAPAQLLPPSHPLYSVDLNLRCPMHHDYLFDVQRYVDGFKQARPNNDHVVFAALAGVPSALVSDKARAKYDFDQASDVQSYYDAILAAPAMQNDPDPALTQGNGNVLPSCTKANMQGLAFPPRRLVEVAKAFGKAAVLGSICDPDFAAVLDRVVQTATERARTP